jgi:hypothetical protein
MLYVNAEERARLIGGLRDLAGFLEEIQEIPVPRWVGVMVFPSAGTDREMKEEIDGIAALIGAEIDDQTADHGHYTTSRHFGPVEYRAVAIPRGASSSETSAPTSARRSK